MKLEVAGPEGIRAVMRLASDCYGERAEPEDWWRWWLFGRGEESSRVALAFGPDGVVGMQPVSFFPFVPGGGVGRCALLTGGMVAPQSRGKGLFRKLVDLAVEEAWHRDCRVVLTMPNERSAPAFERFGWTNLGDRSAMIWLGGGNRARAQESTVVPPEGLSEADVARLAALGVGGTAAAIARDPDWLRWRYRGNPLSKYAIVSDPGPSESKEAAAVGAIRVLRGVRVGFLIDLLGRRGAPRTRAAVALSRELRRRGAVVVASVVGGREARGELEGAGFRRVPGLLVPKRFRTVALARERGPQAVPGRLEDWSLTLADWDGV